MIAALRRLQVNVNFGVIPCVLSSVNYYYSPGGVSSHSDVALHPTSQWRAVCGKFWGLREGSWG